MNSSACGAAWPLCPPRYVPLADQRLSSSRHRAEVLIVPGAAAAPPPAAAAAGVLRLIVHRFGGGMGVAAACLDLHYNLP